MISALRQRVANRSIASDGGGAHNNKQQQQQQERQGNARGYISMIYNNAQQQLRQAVIPPNHSSQYKSKNNYNSKESRKADKNNKKGKWFLLMDDDDEEEDFSSSSSRSTPATISMANSASSSMTLSPLPPLSPVPPSSPSSSSRHLCSSPTTSDIVLHNDNKFTMSPLCSSSASSHHRKRNKASSIVEQKQIESKQEEGSRRQRSNSSTGQDRSQHAHRRSPSRSQRSRSTSMGRSNKNKDNLSPTTTNKSHTEQQQQQQQQDKRQPRRGSTGGTATTPPRRPKSCMRASTTSSPTLVDVAPSASLTTRTTKEKLFVAEAQEQSQDVMVLSPPSSPSSKSILRSSSRSRRRRSSFNDGMTTATTTPATKILRPRTKSIKRHTSVALSSPLSSPPTMDLDMKKDTTKKKNIEKEEPRGSLTSNAKSPKNSSYDSTGTTTTTTGEDMSKHFTSSSSSHKTKNKRDKKKNTHDTTTTDRLRQSLHEKERSSSSSQRRRQLSTTSTTTTRSSSSIPKGSSSTRKRALLGSAMTPSPPMPQISSCLYDPRQNDCKQPKESSHDQKEEENTSISYHDSNQPNERLSQSQHDNVRSLSMKGRSARRRSSTGATESISNGGGNKLSKSKGATTKQRLRIGMIVGQQQKENQKPKEQGLIPLNKNNDSSFTTPDEDDAAHFVSDKEKKQNTNDNSGSSHSLTPDITVQTDSSNDNDQNGHIPDRSNDKKKKATRHCGGGGTVCIDESLNVYIGDPITGGDSSAMESHGMTEISKLVFMCQQMDPSEWSQEFDGLYAVAIEGYITSTIAPAVRALAVFEPNPTKLLTKFILQWQSFCLFRKRVGHTMRLIDRIVDEPINELTRISQIALQCFDKVIFAPYHAKITAALMELIRKERAGREINRFLVSETVIIYKRLDAAWDWDDRYLGGGGDITSTESPETTATGEASVGPSSRTCPEYALHLQEEFVKTTRSYYTLRREKWKDLDHDKYCRNVQDAIHAEQQRNTEYLYKLMVHDSSGSNGTRIIKKNSNRRSRTLETETINVPQILVEELLLKAPRVKNNKTT